MTVRRSYLKGRLQLFSKASVGFKKLINVSWGFAMCCCSVPFLMLDVQYGDCRSHLECFLIHMALIHQSELLHTVTCKPHSVHICCVLEQRRVNIFPVSWPLCIFIMILENSLPLLRQEKTFSRFVNCHCQMNISVSSAKETDSLLLVSGVFAVVDITCSFKIIKLREDIF